ARAEPAAEGDRDPARGRQGDAVAEHVEAARLDRAKEREIGAAPDLGRKEAPRVDGGQRGPRLLVVLAGAPGLEGHELDELRTVAALAQVLRGDPEATEVGLRQIG